MKKNSLNEPKIKSNIVTLSSISNQQCLKRNLKLLEINQEQFEKQTKISFTSELFPKKLANPSSTKQFFFITYFCAKEMSTNDEIKEVEMWYPPRNANEQIQFKKCLFKLLQKLQINGLLPKNFVLSRSVMSESGPSSLLEFLRAFSEFSLRFKYLQRYSKQQNLIQIGINPLNQSNDINNFYMYPFCPTNTVSEPPIKSKVQLESIRQIFKIHIDQWRRKILSLRAVDLGEPIDAQKLMASLQQQRQISQTLQKKVDKKVFGENRAFDRRILLDRNQQIWKELFQMKCEYIDEKESSILNIEGQTAKILSNWRTPSGTQNLQRFLDVAANYTQLKSACQENIDKLKAFRAKLANQFEKK